MATSTTKARTAQIQVQTVNKRSVVTVFVPSKPRTGELDNLNKLLVEKVLKDLTGCPCLSGLAEVILKDDLVDSIKVDLATGRVG
jgi:hypothetical protein